MLAGKKKIFISKQDFCLHDKLARRINNSTARKFPFAIKMPKSMDQKIPRPQSIAVFPLERTLIADLETVISDLSP